MAYDQRRTQYFQSLGIAVLRFSNMDIHHYFDSVCSEIDKVVREREKRFSKPPLQGR